jgi:hypothetical protein
MAQQVLTIPVQVVAQAVLLVATQVVAAMVVQALLW